MIANDSIDKSKYFRLFLVDAIPMPGAASRQKIFQELSARCNRGRLPATKVAGLLLSLYEKNIAI
jgi:hypothetical protein